jgi:CheY-like chemotaxis protein
MILNQVKVLILEDDDFIRQQIARSLEDCGFVVIQAANPKEARTKLQRIDDFDLAILDIDLQAEMTGIEFGYEIRAMKKLRHNPVEIIIYSGNSDSSYYDDAISLGAARYLDKSKITDPEDLVPHIVSLILRRSLRQVLIEKEDLLLPKSIEADEPELFDHICQNILDPLLKSILPNDYSLIWKTPIDASVKPAQKFDFNTILNILNELQIHNMPNAYNLPSGSDYVWLELYEEKGFQIALGIGDPLPQQESDCPKEELGKSIAHYFKSELVAQLVNQIRQMRAFRESHRQAFASIFMDMGLALEQCMKDTEKDAQAVLADIWELARHYQSTARVIDHLEEKNHKGIIYKEVNVGKLMKNVSSRVGETIQFATTLETETFKVSNETILENVVTRMISWMVRRTPNTHVQVTAGENALSYVLQITDSSEPSTKMHRTMMYDPRVDSKVPPGDYLSRVQWYDFIQEQICQLSGQGQKLELTLERGNMRSETLCKVKISGVLKANINIREDDPGLGGRMLLFELKRLLLSAGGFFKDNTDKNKERGHAFVVFFSKVMGSIVI